MGIENCRLANAVVKVSAENRQGMPKFAGKV